MTKRILMGILALTVAGGAAFANGTQEAPGGAQTPGGTATPAQPGWERPGVEGSRAIGAPGFHHMGPGARGFGMGTVLADNLVEDEGVLITGVIDDSAAQAAGLDRGDVILEMDGQEVSTVADLHDVITTKRAGEDVDLRVRSGNEVDTVTVTLDDRFNMPPLGIRGQSEPGSRTAAFMRFFPVRILDVADGSPAAAAGIEAGYLITGIEGDIATGETITVHYANVDLGASGRFTDADVETTELTVGEQDGAPYIGVRYQPLGFGRGPGAGGPGRAGRAATPGGFGPRGGGFSGGGFRGGGPRGGVPRGR
jgi:membrane-associated protease RseP (regulator of RpoE activity)